MREDDELMARVAEGDWDALARLLGRQERPCFAFFYRLGCDPTRIEDLVQEVMIRVYQGRQRYDQTRSFSPWLYGIARNLWRDHLRHRGRAENSLIAMKLADDLPSTATDPLERSQQLEEAELVRRALQRLPEEQRMTLILRHYQGLSYEEIAEALGLPLGTVKWRIHEAIQKLKEWLAVRDRGKARE